MLLDVSVSKGARLVVGRDGRFTIFISRRLSSLDCSIAFNTMKLIINLRIVQWAKVFKVWKAPD